MLCVLCCAVLYAGKPKILNSVRQVVALHKERYVFPVRVKVTVASGTGADTLFTGVLKVGQMAGRGGEAAVGMEARGAQRVKHTP